MLRSPKLRYPKYYPCIMATSRDLPADRLAIGPLLVRLLRQFRAELFEPAAGHGYPDLREPHLHIFGNLGVDGIRLTDLPARAQLSLATASELVSDLQDPRLPGTPGRRHRQAGQAHLPHPPRPSGARRRRDDQGDQGEDCHPGESGHLVRWRRRRSGLRGEGEPAL